MENDYYKQINQSGENLIKAMVGLIQTAKVHLDNNALLVASVKKFVGLVTQTGPKNNGVSIVTSDGRFYFQEHRLQIRPENRKVFGRMLQYMDSRGIYSLHFKSDLSAVSDRDIIAFARIVDLAGTKNATYEWLIAQLEKNNISWVDINSKTTEHLNDSNLPDDETREPDELEQKKLHTRKNYSQILGSVKDVSQKLASNQKVGMRTTVRLVQKMVDLIKDDDLFFSILSTVRIYDDYTYIHSVNVAILAMCLGRQIGLDHRTLERLGLCGLFHDLGKLEIPKSILNKQGSLDDGEYSIIQAHPVHSARLILKLKARRDRKVKILMAPFKHHMGYNGLGYPRIKSGHGTSLFGRILTIADVYDAITSPRIYRFKTLSPDKALGHMLEQSGTRFDPILLKVFINMLGAYPVGTLLKFNTGEMGIVMEKSKGADRDTPLVQLLVQQVGKKFKRGSVVDLSKQDSDTGTPHRVIVESMHPADLEIQAAHFLL